MVGGSAVEVEGLVKEFPAPGGGVLRAVDDVSFAVAEGEVFGLLGPNGAGKTTTLEIIEGLQDPTSGRTRVLGLDTHRQRTAVKQRIGVQLQAGAYFPFLTLEELLDLFGSFYERRVPPAELLEKVGLIDKRRALVGELSGGQAQRFSIVAAMVNDPEVLFLDEPTTGLDPQARHNLWDLIRYINDDEKKTIVLTTHYMEEAELLCDRVAIIDHGRIQALDDPLGLVHGLSSSYRIVFESTVPVPAGELDGLPGVTAVHPQTDGGSRYALEVTDAQPSLEAFMRWAKGSDVDMIDIRVQPATLEDVFLSLTGRSLRE